MVADSLKELHEFATKIGLTKSYYHGFKKGHPHYDALGQYWDKAVSHGAITVDGKTILEKSKLLRK